MEHKFLYVLLFTLPTDKLLPCFAEILERDNLVKTDSTWFHGTMLPPPHGVTSNAPVLQKTMDAYKIWHAHYSNFPRLSKFTLGAKIDSLFTDLIELLYLAVYAGIEQKSAIVVQASTKLDLLKFFMQATWEVRCLDQKKYASLVMPLNEIGKMIGGWQKSLQTKRPPPVR